MNQIKLLLIGMLGIGFSLLSVGVYLAFNQNQPIAQTSTTNTIAVSSPITPVKNPQPTPAKISKNVTVPASVMWFDTGIDVNQTVTIKYLNGKWTNGGDEPIWTDANGSGSWNGVLMPSASFRELIGKVNSNVFSVGNSYEGSPGSGRLYLSINDIPSTFWDNKGQVTVNISNK